MLPEAYEQALRMIIDQSPLSVVVDALAGICHERGNSVPGAREADILYAAEKQLYKVARELTALE